MHGALEKSGLLFPSVIAAWALLIVWDNSSLAAYLDHGDWTRMGILAVLCTVDPAMGVGTSVSLMVGSWLLMVFVMMVPAAQPLFDIPSYDPLPSLRAFCFFPATLVGYFVPWLVFGAFIHGFGYLLNELISLSVWWSVNGWMTGAILFASAGAYQFTKTKRHSLKACCPAMATHDVIGDASIMRQSLNDFCRGFLFGKTCLQCCWPLMMLMFVFWPGSLIWMGVLTAMMIADRRSFFSMPLCQPIGLLLLIFAGGITVVNLV